MARYIDADALGIGRAKREAFTVPEFADGWNSAIDIIENAPTADVVEVKHGEWIKHKRNILKMREVHSKGMGLHMSEKSIFWTCSCCNQWGNVHDKYCSVCGAKMDGVKEE